MDSRAGQTAALFKGSPDQSRGTALLFTHFYLPTLGLELPKQEYLLFLLLKANVFLQVAWQVTYDPPLPPRNGLLSFPSHRLSHSPLLPLILSTRSNFSDPDSSTSPGSFAVQGGKGAPRKHSAVCCAAACVLYQATGSADLPQPLASGRHLRYTPHVLGHKRPSEKNSLKPVFFLPAANYMSSVTVRVSKQASLN